jgi:hypothetical protein
MLAVKTKALVLRLSATGEFGPEGQSAAQRFIASFGNILPGTEPARMTASREVIVFIVALATSFSLPWTMFRGEGDFARAN